MSTIWHLKKPHKYSWGCFPTPVCPVGWQGWQHIREEREIPQKRDIKAPPWEALFSAPSSDWNVRNFKRQTRSRSFANTVIKSGKHTSFSSRLYLVVQPAKHGQDSLSKEFVPSTNALKIQLPTVMLMLRCVILWHHHNPKLVILTHDAFNLSSTTGIKEKNQKEKKK